MTVEKPALFHGDTSGPAWWADFFNWIITATASQTDRVASLGTYMKGPAETWFKSLKPTEKIDLYTLEPLFLAKFPEKTTLDFFTVEDNAIESFQIFLDQGMDRKSLTTTVEAEIKDKTGRVVKQNVCYFHNWIREAYEKASQLPADSMDEATKVFYISRALPREITKYLNVQTKELVPFCQAVVLIRPDHVKAECENADRLSALESRVPVRGIQGTHGAAGAVYKPTTYTPSSAPSPSATSKKAVRGGQHLTFPDTAPGHDLYGKALASFERAHPGDAVSPNVPYPLTPGTPAPGIDICDHCGKKGHIRPHCKVVNSPLPERERKFRGINSAAQRREDREGRGINSLSTEWDPTEFYCDGAGNEAGLA